MSGKPATPQSPQLIIGGEPRPAANGAVFARNNPVSGDCVTRAAAATADDAKDAADAAQRALPAWSRVAPGERRALLNHAADLMMRSEAEFVDCMMAETGATRGWSAFNVAEGARMFREAAAMITQIHGEVVPSDLPGNLALVQRRPLGVCLGIAPWNAPIILGARAVAMPLACGNTAVLKASEACPALHVMIARTLVEAGLGDGIVNVVTNAPQDAAAVVNALIDHPAVRHINFTGSSHVGRLIASRAAAVLKPVLLELGGKSPMLVLDDADIDQAVKAAIFGAFLNQGQICMSTERLVVDEAVADRFANAFAAHARRLEVADSRRREAPLAAVVDARAAERVLELVADARQKGAAVMTGGTAEGALMQPTILDRVTPDMRIYHEESFGPVVSIVRVRGDEEAIRVANDTEFGLSASVFSRDIVRALAVADGIESGICHINGPTVHDEPQMPFGGVKASGYGRFGGASGIEAFTQKRWTTIQREPRTFPF